MSTHEGSREWWSWPRWAIGLATPLLVYTAWAVYATVNARRLWAEQAADPTPGPDSGAGYYVFFMLLLSIVMVAVFVIAAAVFCAFRRLRAFGLGALIGTLLPVLVAGGYLLWSWHELAGAVSRG